MLPEPISLDGVGVGSAACIEASGVHGGDSRSHDEQHGGSVGLEEGIRYRQNEWGAQRRRCEVNGVEAGYRKTRLTVHFSGGILGKEWNLFPQARRGREGGSFSLMSPLFPSPERTSWANTPAKERTGHILGHRQDLSSRPAELRRVQTTGRRTSGLQVSPNHQQGSSGRDTDRLFIVLRKRPGRGCGQRGC